MLFNCSILVTVIVHSYDTDDVTHSQNAVVTRHQGNRLHGVYHIPDTGANNLLLILQRLCLGG